MRASGSPLTRRDFLTRAGAAAAAGVAAVAARPIRDVARWDEEADVVVVGLGAAGASAAIDAARAGASVIVLERAAEGGGTSALSGGILYFGGGTALQKACGYEDSAEAMFTYLMAACGPAPDEAKVRLFCERSVEHFDWVVARGVPFKPSFYDGISLPLTDDGLHYSGSEQAWPFTEIAPPAPRGHKPKVGGYSGGALFTNTLIAAAGDAGAKVYLETIVTTLVQDDARRVVGLVARRGDEERRIRARGGVVLCAGGFCHNRAMVERYAPFYLACDTPIGCPGDDGSAIRMGMGAGGDAVRMDGGFVAMPFHPPETLIEGVLVNAQGQRFINEDCYYGRAGNAILREQGGRAYLVLDERCHAKSKYGRMPLVAEAPTVRELEAKMGLPATTLEATLAFYDRHAARKADPLFRKDPRFLRPLDEPPLRAYDCGAARAYYPFFTLGGLNTRTSGEVLDPEGDPVPGLYAAGRTTLGVSALGYSSGIALNDASFFGRLAGASAAAVARRS